MAAKIVVCSPDTVCLSGPIIFDTVADLWARARDIFPTLGDEVIIDLADITHSDSSALALLLDWCQLGMKLNKTVKIKNIPQQIVAMAQVSDLAGKLPIIDDVTIGQLNG